MKYIYILVETDLKGVMESSKFDEKRFLGKKLQFKYLYGENYFPRSN